ncbi:MAG: DUF1549 domain-containing protein [Planctomycetia bacterium]|nr:DUF1549 domain-containing protein [Planctomycetia bacterium]
MAVVLKRDFLWVAVFAAGWLAGSMAAVADDPAFDLAKYDAIITDADRQHWAFQRIERHAIPAVRDVAWPRNPIDNFVLAKLEAKGWRPAERATDEKWLRRVYLDVLGLPPTPEQQAEFLADRSPDKRERVVDQLLASPGYGERWARHWLDLVRYAETNGYERDAKKPSAWRYRDWVISALNADLPYDRFVTEQLAGDELEDADEGSVTATGYYRLGPWDDEPADFAQDRFDQLDDIIDTTSQAFLGLTLACARCHNHKFEPLTALDYYRMVAILDPLKRPQNGRQELDLPAAPPAKLAALETRDRKIAERNVGILALRDKFRAAHLASGQSKLGEEVVAAFTTEDAKRTPPQRELVQKHQAALESELTANLPDETRQKIADAEAQIAALKRELPDPPRAYYLREPSPQPPKTHLLLRGQAASPGPEVQPGVPTVLAARQPEFLAPDEHTTRRRLSFARWVTSPDNPLMARVIVNRVWQFHFGEGLVRTPSDFGVMGASPTHDQLLDWLAHWFVHNAHWSLKELHRLILTSSAYGMSSAWNEEYGGQDPDNMLLWRFPYRRLSVEAIHDSMLAASGRINRQMFGPSVFMHVPKEALEGHSDPDKIWQPFNEAQGSRRAVYAYIKRSLVVPMLEVLDLCDCTRSAAGRNVTHVAPQALTLFNGDFVNRQAQRLSERLVREAGDDRAAQVRLAYRLALCREASVDQVAAIGRFLDEQAAEIARAAKESGRGISEAESREAARVQFCRVLFNLNEFVYPD